MGKETEKLAGNLKGNVQVINGMRFFIDDRDINYYKYKLPKGGSKGRNRGNRRTGHKQRYHNAQHSADIIERWRIAAEKVGKI